MLSIPRNQLRLTLALLCTLAVPMTAQVERSFELPSMGDASAKSSVDFFQGYAKYPPESRPLNSKSWELLHPWLTESAPTSLVPSRVVRQIDALQNSGLSEDEIAEKVAMPSFLPSYQFSMNKTIVTGTKDEITAQLRVTSPEDPSAALPFQVRKVELIGDGYFGSSSLGSVPFACETADSVCVFTWSAPSADKKYWGGLELDVTVTVDGMADEFVARQSFYSSPMVAGRFTGNFSERLEDGSLVIDAGVDVQKRMACFVTANLYSVDKAVPTHFAERRIIVDPSMKTIPLMFFGKIFRDSGFEGSFRLQDLKAQCENLAYPPEWFMDSLAHQAELQNFHVTNQTAPEPTRIYFEYNAYSYVTRRYSAGDFSDAEWQSPAKTRKLQMLEKAAEDLSDPSIELRKQH